MLKVKCLTILLFGAFMVLAGIHDVGAEDWWKQCYDEVADDVYNPHEKAEKQECLDPQDCPGGETTKSCAPGGGNCKDHPNILIVASKIRNAQVGSCISPTPETTEDCVYCDRYVCSVSYYYEEIYLATTPAKCSVPCPLPENFYATDSKKCRP